MCGPEAAGDRPCFAVSDMCGSRAHPEWRCRRFHSRQPAAPASWPPVALTDLPFERMRRTDGLPAVHGSGPLLREDGGRNLSRLSFHQLTEQRGLRLSKSSGAASQRFTLRSRKPDGESAGHGGSLPYCLTFRKTNPPTTAAPDPRPPAVVRG